MSSRSFTNLKNQMDRVTAMLVQYEGLVTHVKGVQQKLAIEHTGWTQGMKGDVDDDLHTAQRCLSQLLVALERARKFLAETQVVDMPGAAGAVGQGEAEAKQVPQDLDMSQLLRRLQDVRE
jgi:hypothetical protein